MRLNVDTKHKYSASELARVKDDHPRDSSMHKVVNAAMSDRFGFYTAGEITCAGRTLCLENAADAVLDALRKNRTPTVANDDDVLTVGQLREAIRETVRGFSQGQWVSVGSADDFVDQVMERVNHPWESGDIVKDAIGNWYKRTRGNHWQVFGSGEYISDATPVRPLKKIN